jgi:hypothetical protein
MTLSSSSPVTLSSLGEVSISYLDWLAPGLSVSVHRLIHDLGAITSSFVRQLSPPHHPSSDQLSVSSLTALVLTVLAGALVVAAMSWRAPFNFWRRGSPYGTTSMPPQVSDSDYSYLTPEDIVDPPRAYEQPPYSQRRPHPSRDPTDENGPDILLLKHRGVTYPLHFAPYAIADGLTVGEVRQHAAETMRAPDPQRVTIMYKGKLLKDNARPCKDEGIKQESEIMCVVSEVQPGESTSDLSGSDDNERLSEPPNNDASDSHTRHGKSRKRNKKKKKRTQNPRPASMVAEPASSLAPPMDQRPSSSGRSSAAPSPAPSFQNLRTPLEKVNALAEYFHNSLVPLCEQYFAHPPEDAKAQDFERRRLSETILAQVILKADGIVLEADGVVDEDARDMRKALIKEAQAMLGRLDKAAQ